ncbi:CYTH domain-containing protein [Candidatus Uhrbacteria bacterium]|nr:CYTH domain-containing protein [Candidatus Uhrbacteria bacterium]
MERKFLLTDDEIERLTADAQFFGVVVNVDTYFDTPTFDLTIKDIWLRQRGERFEIKMPMHTKLDRIANQYDEIEDEMKIREILNLSTAGKMADALASSGYVPFGSLKTTRKKYRKGDFTIDLDLADFGDWTYQIGEVELMVSDRSEIEWALQKMSDFIQKHRLEEAPVRGKIIEFLKQKRPAHYRTLVEAGVVKSGECQ